MKLTKERRIDLIYLKLKDIDFIIHSMETTQYIFALIALAPFVIWALILLGFFMIAKSNDGRGASLMSDRKGRETNGRHIALSELPDVTLEHYYLRETERAPFNPG